jgi:tetratricopeptide (TPR) repeat protein
VVDIIASLDALRDACSVDVTGQSTCDRARYELQRLALICPAHELTLFANAAVAYDARRAAEAQQYLDLILARPGGHPEAAILRARIAVEEGNIPYARRLLDQQIKIVPDHSGLHETLGGVLYFARDWTNATRELTSAGAFGAPRWRIAYHLGLVAEAQGNVADARRLYMEALQANPQVRAAQSRLAALPPP